MYPINEIFCSLQGEGEKTGTVSVFIRMSGCNLRCAFCDTDHQSHTMMSAPEIVEQVMRYPGAPLIVLTGGEPALHIDNALIQALKLTGKTIAIETNGTLPLPDGIDWVTLSPKTAFQGGEALPCIITSCDELKVVYTGQNLNQYDHIKAQQRFLQPCYVDDPKQRLLGLQATVKAVLDNPKWRLSLQTHKLLGIR
jgi:organic radical activating enzyme